ncbi:MAG TPA: RidA family protein [Bauldia sp.]|nr:RidA family protein [Bauldia sp.]
MARKPAAASAPASFTTPNGAVFYGDPLPYPISRAVRAGDFVITSAFGDRVPLPEETVYDRDGFPLPTGKRIKTLSFAEEAHGTFRTVSEALALAGCTFDDVVDSQVWLRDPRDFLEMNRIYATYFTKSRPIRSVFQNAFMLEFRIELKVVAYKPLK